VARHREIIRLVAYAENLGIEEPDLTDDEVCERMKKAADQKILPLRKNMIVMHAFLAAYRKGANR